MYVVYMYIYIDIHSYIYTFTSLLNLYNILKMVKFTPIFSISV